MSKSTPKHGKHAKAQTSEGTEPLADKTGRHDADAGTTQVLDGVAHADADGKGGEEPTAYVDPYATKAFAPVKGAVGEGEAASDDGTTAQHMSNTPHLSDMAPQDPAYIAAGIDGAASKKHGKIAAIVAGVIAGVLLAVYLVGIGIFSNWYFPGTTIGSIDASMKTSADVQSELNSAVADYQVAITGDGFNYTFDATKAGVSIDASAITSEMHQALPAWQWPYLLTQSKHDLSSLFSTSYSGTSELNNAIKTAVDDFNKTATQPTDATIEYNADKNQFQVKSEVAGTAISADEVVSKVDDAILSFEKTAKLDSSDLVQPKIVSTDERLASAASAATRMASVTLKLTMGGQDAGAIDPDTVSQWITLDESYTPSINEEALSNYINDLESKLDTVGTTRTYTRADGKQVSVTGGIYGWEVDHDSLSSLITDAVKSGQSQTIDIPCITEGDAYNGAGQRDWGNRYIDIDLTEQHVRMYDDSGNLIWESDCISGIPDGEHNTSVGVYWINQKASPSKLIGYDRNGNKLYESTVRYWMPFDGNAIGLHDADWQPGFGGDMYEQGYGSHGCVNLPVDAAAQLYQLVQEGDCVVSHY